MIWTPETAGHLCRRYREGALFCEIAKELGTTKNAAIGKFNRMVKHGHPLARQAADRRTGTADRVATWMAAYGGSIADCARSLGQSYEQTKSAWDRVRQRLGDQAR